MLISETETNVNETQQIPFLLLIFPTTLRNIKNRSKCRNWAGGSNFSPPQ